MKKLIITGMAVAMLAVPSAALAEGGMQPGYDVANGNTVCAGHGAFGWFGEQSGTDGRHDLGMGDTGGDASLGASPQTALNNSGLCGNGTPELRTVTTPLR